MIDLTPKQLTILLHVLTSHLPKNTKVYIFGSRITGKAKPFSDIDLAIDALKPLSLEQLALLNHEFDESNLPFKVDLVDWHGISDDFRNRISQHCLPILP